MVEEVSVATVQAETVDWDAAEREGRRAASFVGMFVGVPALVAAGASLLIFALVWVVLLAPLIAAALTWVAWRYGNPNTRGVLVNARPRRAP